MKKLLITATLLLLLSLKPLFAGVAKGVDVREVQTILTELCFNVGPIDGVWGKRVSMVKAGSDRVNRKRMLVCSKCNHSKTYDFDNHDNPFLNSPD